ncbi:hypothetical protein AWC38_SpisGene13866 [Stylophora pistillata]|uniref:Uncharacterized protein n=1 Tax=Stylophora pistillata TaxID=50429 RepID=A0A2B4RZF3_STYPI|nr:hypothetical protein AWC38_SpisGene13866 [Stylophora pistillata]
MNPEIGDSIAQEDSEISLSYAPDKTSNFYFILQDPRSRRQILFTTLQSYYSMQGNAVLEATESSRDGQMQEKRQKSSDNSEMKQAIKTKRNKAPSPGRKAQEASKVPGQRGQSQVNNKANDLKDPFPQTTTSVKRKKQVTKAHSAPIFESEGSLADAEDSETMYCTEKLSELTDREFLQQQIRILKMPFELEKDCPSLSKIKEKDAKHVPLQVINNALRKVNHKTEDVIMQNLNRLAQRKLLENLSAVRQDSRSSSISDKGLKRYKEVQERVTNLEKVHQEIPNQHAQHKDIGNFVSQLESDIEKFDNKELVAEIRRTNNLLDSGPDVSLTDKDDPCSQEQLVQILFKD